MHTALVQRLMRDRSAWELAHVYDEAPQSAEPAPAEVGAAILPETLAVHA
jgi:UDP-3-O-[3-hydroxymyristoyl] N-acetylglucosamine deacetylase